MKKAPKLILLLIFLTSILFQADNVQADGIIIPVPPICPASGCLLPPFPMQQLEIRYHHVKVMIENQLVTTRVDQVFFNPNDYTIEGTYVFPLPPDAVVSQFVLWVDGKPVEGKVLDADEARQIYEESVRKMADPALLEYVGRGAVQASIYPIPPQGERRIELEYQQVLTSENGLVRYQYPLNTEKFSATPLESVTVDVSIQANLPIRAVYSPSHPVEVQRRDDRNVLATYEAVNSKPDTDFVLFYSIGENQAFHLMSFMEPQDASDPGGYFLMLLAPEIGGLHEVVAKDVVLILDRSGSMEGEKFQQAQAALTYILEHLNVEDRFFLMAFSSDTQAFSERLASVSQADEAINWINQMGAMGSTEIDRALMEVARVVDEERPTYLIFLTDGLPTRGITDIDQILTNVSQEMPENVRVFPFGVGYDVDTFLLDSLAQNQHGLSTYVQPEEALDERLSAFYEKISTPVLTDLIIDFGGLDVYDVFPNPLPDLFEGNQVIVTGRYREGKTVEISLRGETNGAMKQYFYPAQRFADGKQGLDQNFSSLPRLWATRKIGSLLNQLRLNGTDQETIDQIVRLSLRYGIVTPYTSYLVTEDMPMGEEAQREAAQNAYSHALTQPTQATFGMDAVQKAAAGGAMSQAEQPAAPSVSEGRILRTAGGKTFILLDGIWMDTTFDPKIMIPMQIEFISDAYFELSANNENLAAALALGEKVIVVHQGQAIQVISQGKEGIQEITKEPTTIPTGQVHPVSVIEPIEAPINPTEWITVGAGGLGIGLIVLLVVIGWKKKQGK